MKRKVSLTAKQGINKRPINPTRFTKSGYEKLKKEYEEMKSQRPSAVEDLKKAREMGDLKENGYYQASRQKLNTIDAGLTRMSYHIKYASIIEETGLEVIGMGSTVTLANNEREMTYQFVGDLEANPSEGKLSLLSPMGRAVEGKKVGDIVEVKTHAGNFVYTVKKLV
jgi:transcription elongation factor GreA